MRRVLPIIIAAALLLCGCGKADVDYSGISPSEDSRLIIYTSHKEEVYTPLIREFEQRTGIWVELYTGGSNELLELIAKGDTDCDLMFGGGVDSLSAYTELFSPYESESMKNVDEKYKGDSTWTPFSSLPVVLIYNTKLIRVNPPSGWASLLDSAWKGKIAFADPKVSGSSYTALCTMIQALKTDADDALEAFAENLDGNQLEGSSLVISAVDEGRCYIGVTLEETALKAIDAGCDIGLIYPEEGTSALPDGAAIIKGCRHEQNAKLFIDFFLSEDVQRRLPEYFSRRSVLIGAEQGETEELRLLKYDLEWAGSVRSELLGKWESCFAGGTA